MFARVRRHLTYANVVSSLCLLIVLGGGTAYAAITITGKNVDNGSLTGADIKNNSVTGSDVKSLTARDFKGGKLPAGPQGATGPQGPQGATGQAGANGSPAGSINTGVIQSTGFGSYFGSPSGPSGSGTESDVQTLTPAGAPITASDLSVKIPFTLGATGSPVVTTALRVNGTDTALTCSFTTGSDSCQDTTHVVTIPPNSRISIRTGLVGTGTFMGTRTAFGWRAGS